MTAKENLVIASIIPEGEREGGTQSWLGKEQMPVIMGRMESLIIQMCAEYT